MADIVVVGGGVGGLCAAIRLRVAGHRVTIVERNEQLGGKLATRVRDGFTFDTGPSLLTLPQLFADVIALTGSTLSDEVDLVRLDPQVRHWWPDGSTLDALDSADATAAAFDALAAGAGEQWLRFQARAERTWTVAERTFLAGAMTSARQLAAHLRSPADLLAIDPLRTLDGAARRAFHDARLHQWVGRYATYSGSSPFRAPATLACIAHVEARHGAWYVRGGLGALRDALVRAATRVGVIVRCSCEVTAINADASRVRGIALADGERLPADVVIANVDAAHLHRDLLPDDHRLRAVRRAEPSGSGFVILAGVRGRTERIAHHNVWFSPSYRREYDALDAGMPADEPTIYACVSAVTDATQAPAGDENWFILVNTPPGGRWSPGGQPSSVGDGATVTRYHDQVLDQLAARGVDLRARLAFTETITPADIAARFRAEAGAIYGTSSNGRRAAFVRPANRGRHRGLYLVGGSSHPGGGLPLVAISGRIVADLVGEDGW